MILCGKCQQPFADDVDVLVFHDHYERCQGGDFNMKLVPNGETTRQYVVNWEINGEGKGEVFESRAGLFKQARQLIAVGVPFTVTRTTLQSLTISGD